MEKWITLILETAKNYGFEILLAAVICSIILMIIVLKTLHKNNRLTKAVEERVMEMLKLSMEQIRKESQRENIIAAGSEKKEKRHSNSREDEELFGSVIQEFFP